jgi:hypothetical protein
MAKPAPNAPLYVICDRCRAQGRTDEDPFEQFGALLDFEPVPRKHERADGWGADVQRTYIAALSLTGSDAAACRAVGKSPFGVKQLIDHEGSAGFRAAREQAMEMAEDERGRRLAEGLRAVAADRAGWTPPEAPWAHAQTRRGSGRPPHQPLPPPLEWEDDPDEELTLEGVMPWLGEVFRKYLLKVDQERDARLDGKIVEADFYLRQLTWLEVVLDICSGDGAAYMRDYREGGHDLIDMAETPMSRILGNARRMVWQEEGEPDRPEHPPRDRLVDHGRFSTEPQETTRGGLAKSHEQQKSEFEERHHQAAEEQLKWEARARAQAAEWRARLEAPKSPSPISGWPATEAPSGGRSQAGHGHRGEATEGEGPTDDSSAAGGDPQ